MITEEQYKEAVKIIAKYKFQQLDKPRYKLDIRFGCGAVIDMHHKDYNPDYPGLHEDTAGVVAYRHGKQTRMRKKT